ncbi:HlyD family secretion protein [Cytophagaceae bacterium DM2B3-1]|uniref:HlyD family secretion protein n=2 Tax=Xanthocytophaga TaxID=3078918 RepID=A0AAE3U823_9BACT|nr:MULTISPECIES: HlyD family secretion protein [Xanthocytophaga]MDJ1469616.1 HlyD family secretion protein [Xanthocytophaga flavus]MDJ1480738.1 HlyD family secretion protein [Xanthocytophaga flavus]MDJ1493562.1 HlyD family secretion protein [Xanthocytophaga flavus]MDJ1506207.1 HlyD family secretion protein [Xanthocytophaga agilis]
MSEKKSKNFALPIILGIVILSAGAYGFTKYTHSLHYVDTDDAQLDGDIVPVVAKVGGYVNSVLFEDNQKVSKDQLLVKIEDTDYLIKVRQADASLQSVMANVGVSKSTVVSTQAGIATAKSAIEAANIRLWKANQDYTRYKNLYDDKVVTAQQFDAIKAEKDAAEAQLASAKSQYDVASKQVGTSVSQVSAASSNIALRQADLDFAKLQLSYTSVSAPVSGTVAKKNIQPGQLVQAGQSLFVVVNDSSIYVTANFKETQLKKMKPGNPVTIVVDAYPDEPIAGEVASFSPATGAKFSLLPPDNATGNFVKVVQRVPVRIKLKADKAMREKLHPGMSVTAEVKID